MTETACLHCLTSPPARAWRGLCASCGNEERNLIQQAEDGDTMSNQRNVRNPSALDQHLTTMFAALANQRIAGGCDDCDAFQTMKTEEGVHFIRVHHDDTCPWLNGDTR